MMEDSMDKMYVPYRSVKKYTKWWHIAIVFITIISGYCIAAKSDKPEEAQKPHIVYYRSYLDNHRDFTLYFLKSGSKTPQQMAEAVLHTKSPRLLAAMATKETNGNHAVRNTGYKKRHHGAWQVNPKYWGKVSNSPVEQAKQAETILEDLAKVSNNDINSILAKYGGDSTNSYAKKILAELVNVPNY